MLNALSTVYSFNCIGTCENPQTETQEKEDETQKKLRAVRLWRILAQTDRQIDRQMERQKDGRRDQKERKKEEEEEKKSILNSYLNLCYIHLFLLFLHCSRSIGSPLKSSAQTLMTESIREERIINQNETKRDGRKRKRHTYCHYLVNRLHSVYAPRSSRFADKMCRQIRSRVSQRE